MRSSMMEGSMILEGVCSLQSFLDLMQSSQFTTSTTVSGAARISQRFSVISSQAVVKCGSARGMVSVIVNIPVKIPLEVDECFGSDWTRRSILSPHPAIELATCFE